MFKYIAPVIFIIFGLIVLFRSKADYENDVQTKSDRTFNKSRDEKWMRVVGAILIVVGIFVLIKI